MAGALTASEPGRAPWWRSRPAIYTERRDSGPGLIRANMDDRQEVETMAMVRSITNTTDITEDGKVTTRA